jgi:uncharacterized protein (TIGR02266 family)
MLQAEPRFRKRVPCTLRSSSRAHSGMVLNLSRGGLFVQTSAHVPPGKHVSVELNIPGAESRIPVGARVVWRRIVAPQLRTVSHGGFGVRIQNAPEEYFRFLSGVVTGAPPAAQPTAPAAAAVAAAGASERAAGCALYRVRLQQSAGPRTRWISVSSASEEAAGQLALAEAGSGWVVLASERAE